MPVSFACDFCGKDLGAYREPFGSWEPEKGLTFDYYDEANLEYVNLTFCNNNVSKRDRDGIGPYSFIQGCVYDFISANKIEQVIPNPIMKNSYYRKVK